MGHQVEKHAKGQLLLSGNVNSGLECAFNNNRPLYTHAVSHEQMSTPFNAIQLNINRQIQCIRTTDKKPT